MTTRATVLTELENRGFIFTTASYLAELINRKELEISVALDGIQLYAERKNLRQIEISNFKLELLNRLK